MNVSYQDFVAKLIKPFPDPTHRLLHAAIGISGEAGELLDAVKKHWAYDRVLDLTNVKEELGDLLFYIQDCATQCGWTLDEVIQANVAKLSKRYHQGTYSNEQANERADKAELAA